MNDVLFLGVSVVCWFLGYDLVCSDHARSSYHTILAKPRKAGFFYLTIMRDQITKMSVCK